MPLWATRNCSWALFTRSSGLPESNLSVIGIGMVEGGFMAEMGQSKKLRPPFGSRFRQGRNHRKRGVALPAAFAGQQLRAEPIRARRTLFLTARWITVFMALAFGIV